jgi:hypothetical protein
MGGNYEIFHFDYFTDSIILLRRLYMVVGLAAVFPRLGELVPDHRVRAAGGAGGLVGTPGA